MLFCGDGQGKGSELEHNYTLQLYLQITVTCSFVPVFCFSEALASSV